MDANPNQETPVPSPVLSFDVEEYFQVEAAAGRLCPGCWSRMPRRLDKSVDQILELLHRHRQRATFFILGWVARNEPHIVRRIADAGFEIASHGMNHQMLQRLTPEQFRRDLVFSRKALEDISGRHVVGYRAPTFSITHRTAWAIDELAAAGYQYDSSIFPVRHDRYGVPDAPRFAHRAVSANGDAIIELPPLTRRIAGVNIPVGGGGYLRLLPAKMIAKAIRRHAHAGHAAMIYLHPWEFDPDQPILPMTMLSRFRHRINLSRTADKLDWLMTNFSFQEARQCLQAIPADQLPIHVYGDRTQRAPSVSDGANQPGKRRAA
jgi:polysaccharide deacetylase family protein (PEP-CTERM system associated)